MRRTRPLEELGIINTMDTTNKHIKICEKAVEVQKLWEPTVGDYVALARFPGHGFILEIKTEGKIRPLYQIEHGFNNQYKSELIWLPTQDQLQKLFIEEAKKTAPPEVKNISYSLLLITSIHEYYIDWPEYCWPYDFKDVSLEQLWLNLLMSLIFDKSWDGKEWA